MRNTIDMAYEANLICAIDDPVTPWPEVHDLTEELEAFANLVAQHEREACAKIAESMSLTDANMNKTWRTGCRDVAEAIRARSNT